MDNKISLEQMLEEEMLELPFEDDVRTVREGLHWEGEVLPKIGGVYLLYTEYSSLYAGKTDNLQRRLFEHSSGRGSVEVYRWLSEFKEESIYVSYIIEEEPIRRDIYESYILEKYRPRYNVDKLDRKITGG